MVYAWCVKCLARENLCTNAESHRAQNQLRWRVDFYLGGRHGKRVRQTMKEGVTKKEAEKYEHLSIADYERSQILPVVSQKSKMKFKEFIDVYFKEHVIRYLKGAVEEEYRLRFLMNMWKDRPLHSIKHEDGELYIGKRLEEGIAKTTINRELVSIKSMFNWAVDNGYVAKNPLLKVKRFKVDVIRIRWLDDQEIELLKEGCRKLKDFDLEDLIVVGLNCGFRDANLKALTPKSILGNRLQALKTKSGKPYDVPISDVLQERLDKLIRMRAPKALLNFRNIRSRWDQLIKFVGLHKPKRDPNNVTIHTLRHTFAAQCLRRRVPLNVVCEWLGHYSIEFTRKHYGHLCPKEEDKYMSQVNIGKEVTA